MRISALHEQLELLKQLQAIDSTLKKIEKLQLDSPKKIQHLEKEFEHKKQWLEKRKSSFEEVQKQRRKKEQELNAELERIQKSQDKVSLVKTNKEYQAALKEIDDLKQHTSDIETEILILMEKTDTIAQEIKKEELEYQNWLTEFEKEKDTFQRELEKSNQELQDQQKIRSATVEHISADLLKKYEILIERRQGLAVVAIHNNFCTGCNINIPPQKILEIRKNCDMIMNCPFCNRIIYFNEQQSETTSWKDLLKQTEWPLAPTPGARGKSELRRTECWVTPSPGNGKESATEKRPPLAGYLPANMG